MPNPKHHNPSPAQTARAPYNFIPLPEKVVTVKLDDIPGHDTYKHHTGYLDCTLTTESPLYTRCAQNLEFFKKFADNPKNIKFDEKDRHEYAQFFNVDNTEHPIIPGSSLRGMTRALVEIAGFGKMQWVTNEQLFFRTMDNTAVGAHYRDRMVKDNVKGGFLHQRGNQYYIKECQVARIDRRRLGRDLYEGSGPNQTPQWAGKPYQYQPVWVELSTNRKFVENIHYKPTISLEEGRLVITGYIPDKKKEFIFLLPKQEAEEIIVPYEVIERFHDDDQITQWQQRAFPKDKPQNHARRKDGWLRQNLSGEGDPVFFLWENNQLTFLGRAQMFRLPYKRSPKEFIPKPLQREADIDLTEAIFGYTPEGDRKEGRAGRVYFTDAHYERDEAGIWLQEGDGIITPKILSGPKPTTFQHYLVQDGRKGHNPDNKSSLAHYGTSTPAETVIRGHKLYWHRGSNPAISEDRPSENPEHNGKGWKDDTQHTQIKPVKPGVTFCFKIHFENLCDYELGALLWVLDLPADYRQKIGMGKPLGLGAVKITPQLVLSTRSERYSQLFEGNNWATSEQREANLAKFKQAFEEFVLREMDGNERKTAFRDVERIKMLLTMLRWPGPDLEQTKYMTLDNEDKEKFKNRFVLPDPLYFEDHSQSPQRPSLKPDQKPSLSSPSRQAAKPTVISEYPINYTFTAKVEVTWNEKTKKLETKMPNGAPAILDMSRKEAAKLGENPVQLVVSDFKNGVYYLEQA